MMHRGPERRGPDLGAEGPRPPGHVCRRVGVGGRTEEVQDLFSGGASTMVAFHMCLHCQQAAGAAGALPRMNANYKIR